MQQIFVISYNNFKAQWGKYHKNGTIIPKYYATGCGTVGWFKNCSLQENGALLSKYRNCPELIYKHQLNDRRTREPVLDNLFDDNCFKDPEDAGLICLGTPLCSQIQYSHIFVLGFYLIYCKYVFIKPQAALAQMEHGVHI